jgi:hypothetical protein
VGNGIETNCPRASIWKNRPKWGLWVMWVMLFCIN